MGKSKTGKIATGCTAVAFLFVLIAFVSPNWLETDGELDNPKFIKIGKYNSALGVAAIFCNFNLHAFNESFLSIVSMFIKKCILQYKF